MHISDGVLPIGTSITGYVVAGLFLYRSAQKIALEDIVKTASMSALFFVVSLVHIPIGISQFHLLLIGLIGVYAGFGAFLSIFVALFLQSLLLGFGGLASLGVNACIMGLSALFVGYIFRVSFFKKISLNLRFFLVGFLGVFFASLLFSLVLLVSQKEYFYASIWFLFMQVPIMFLEGIISVFLMKSLSKFGINFD